MGTNFYWLNDEKEESIMNNDPNVHIGKRSGAGPYCNGCGVTQVHSSNTGWHRVCPSCAKKMEELKTTCSFTWTKMDHYKKIKELAKSESDKKCIINENNEKFTAKEFLDIVKECKIWFQFYGNFC